MSGYTIVIIMLLVMFACVTIFILQSDDAELTTGPAADHHDQATEPPDWESPEPSELVVERADIVTIEPMEQIAAIEAALIADPPIAQSEPEEAPEQAEPPTRSRDV